VPGKRDRPYDRFRARIVFPLADDRGRTLGFGARALGDEKPKYLNSPETALYHKSEALFGLHTAKSAAQRADRVYVVEGYTDVLALAQAGVQETVAAMGTALTEQQLTRLSRLTRQLYLCFDADAAGLGAMSRALTLARRLDLTMYVVRMPEGLDPADYLTGGATGDEFVRLADRAESVLHYRVRQVLDAHDLERSDGRAQAFAQLKGMLADAASPVERDDEVRHIAGRLRLSEESVRHLLRSGAAPPAARAGSAEPAPGAAVLVGGAHELEVRFLAACLAVPEAGAQRLAGIDEGYFASAETRDALRWTTARLTRQNAGKKSPAASVAEAVRTTGARCRGGRAAIRPGAVHHDRSRRALPARAGGARGAPHREAQARDGRRRYSYKAGAGRASAGGASPVARRDPLTPRRGVPERRAGPESDRLLRRAQDA
jgi:DNA primase